MKVRFLKLTIPLVAIFLESFAIAGPCVNDWGYENIQTYEVSPTDVEFQTDQGGVFSEYLYAVVAEKAEIKTLSHVFKLYCSFNDGDKERSLTGAKMAMASTPSQINVGIGPQKIELASGPWQISDAHPTATQLVRTWTQPHLESLLVRCVQVQQLARDLNKKMIIYPVDNSPLGQEICSVSQN